MAVFGRLDVFYPDGRVESYPLSGDTVSVGRAEGNTIALDTETISRYHFSITQKDGVVQLTDLDSANGTYIDGTQLNSNDPLRVARLKLLSPTVANPNSNIRSYYRDCPKRGQNLTDLS